MSRIAFVKTGDRVEGTRRALALLDLPDMAGKSVLIKPNFNSADPTPGSTHIDVLRELVAQAQGAGAASVAVGDRSGMGDTRAVMAQLGVLSLAAELGFEAIVFDELPAEGWVHWELPDGHWKQGFYVAKPLLDADLVVQTCCLKTHRFGGHFTLSLKNSVGAVAKLVPGDEYNYMRELHRSPDQRVMIAEVNASYSPDLVVMDGVQAFTDGGPDAGTLVDSQVVLAGSDRVALDAVGVAILRKFGTTAAVGDGPLLEQAQLARAIELGIGVGDPAEIQFLTDDQASASYAAEILDIMERA